MDSDHLKGLLDQFPGREDIILFLNAKFSKSFPCFPLHLFGQRGYGKQTIVETLFSLKEIPFLRVDCQNIFSEKIFLKHLTFSLKAIDSTFDGVENNIFDELCQRETQLFFLVTNCDCFLAHEHRFLTNPFVSLFTLSRRSKFKIGVVFISESPSLPLDYNNFFVNQLIPVFFNNLKASDLTSFLVLTSNHVINTGNDVLDKATKNFMYQKFIANYVHVLVNNMPFEQLQQLFPRLFYFFLQPLSDIHQLGNIATNHLFKLLFQKFIKHDPNELLKRAQTLHVSKSLARKTCFDHQPNITSLTELQKQMLVLGYYLSNSIFLGKIQSHRLKSHNVKMVYQRTRLFPITELRDFLLLRFFSAKSFPYAQFKHELQRLIENEYFEHLPKQAGLITFEKDLIVCAYKEEFALAVEETLSTQSLDPMRESYL